MLHIHPSERIHRLALEKLKYSVEILRTGLLHFHDCPQTREVSFQWIRPQEDILLTFNYEILDSGFVPAVKMVAIKSNSTWLLSMLKVNGYPKTIPLSLRESLVLWCAQGNNTKIRSHGSEPLIYN
jgi:hypothetical protein